MYPGVPEVRYGCVLYVPKVRYVFMYCMYLKSDMSVCTICT